MSKTKTDPISVPACFKLASIAADENWSPMERNAALAEAVDEILINGEAAEAVALFALLRYLHVEGSEEAGIACNYAYTYLEVCQDSQEKMWKQWATKGGRKVRR